VRKVKCKSPQDNPELLEYKANLVFFDKTTIQPVENAIVFYNNSLNPIKIPAVICAKKIQLSTKKRAAT